MRRGEREERAERPRVANACLGGVWRRAEQERDGADLCVCCENVSKSGWRTKCRGEVCAEAVEERCLLRGAG